MMMALRNGNAEAGTQAPSRSRRRREKWAMKKRNATIVISERFTHVEMETLIMYAWEFNQTH
jgi:hypothetical protein